MARVQLYLVIVFIVRIISIHGEYLPVKISVDKHINLVSDRFLSFTVDPKFLFENGELGNNCLCMASSLSPAYIRIAGPSTSLMDFQNSSILFNSSGVVAKNNNVSVPHDERMNVDLHAWTRFAEWAKVNNFEVVFALNNDVKMASGLWDPNTALDILTVAEQSNIENIVWQLGYECRNSTAEEYADELETLRVMVGTFPRGRSGAWRVVAGDVSGCLDSESKSSFADYISDTSATMDALFLNGTSTVEELKKMSAFERRSVLETFNVCKLPIWISDRSDDQYELFRAVEWLMSLGYSARVGFHVNFREIRADELSEPTLSYYMSLLYKKLVGTRVLDVNVQNNGVDAGLFAHCTTFDNKPVPGAITLYGVNMDDQAAKFAISFSRREEGTDIMQFILSLDKAGNIIINGRSVHEGDVKPVVKRVRPYKTLIINVPPRSFGFWVLANANAEACLNTNSLKPTFLPATSVEHIGNSIVDQRIFQSRRKRDISPLKSDVILHKSISENEILKNKFNPEDEKNDVDTQELNEVLDNINDLNKILSNTQKLVDAYSFFENIASKSEEEIDSENTDEMLINTIYRHKRQTVDLKAGVSKLETNVNKPSLIKQGAKPAPTKSPLLLSSRLSKLIVNDETKKVATKPTKIQLKPNKDLKSTSNTQEQSEPLIKDVRARLLELKSKLQARRINVTNRVKLIKAGLKLSKRSIDGTNIISVDHERKRRAVGELKKSDNEITSYINKLEHPIDSEKEKETNNHILKKLLKKIDDFKIPPLIELSEDRDDLETNTVDDESSVNENENVSKVKNNALIKEKYRESDDEAIEDQILVKTKISDDDTSISVNEKSNHQGMLKKAFGGVSSVLYELKDTVSRLWTLLNAFDG